MAAPGYSTDPFYTIRIITENAKTTDEVLVWILRDEWDKATDEYLGSQQLQESGLWTNYVEAKGGGQWGGTPEPTHRWLRSLMGLVSGVGTSGKGARVPHPLAGPMAASTTWAPTATTSANPAASSVTIAPVGGPPASTGEKLTPEMLDTMAQAIRKAAANRTDGQGMVVSPAVKDILEGRAVDHSE